VPRLWYEDIDGYLQSIGFRQSAKDPNLYLQRGVLLVLYVDDLLIGHNSAEGRGHRIKQLLQMKYKMCDLGTAKRFLGIEIERTKDGGFSISQRGYINTIIRRFELMDAKPAKSPLDPQTDLANTHCEDKPANRKEYLSMVGSLMYAALGSRPDIAFSVTTLSLYNVQPVERHATAAKRVLRYLKTTAEFRIHYRRLTSYPQSPQNSLSINIIGYTDSDWAGNLTTCKSVRGCVFGLGHTNANEELVMSGLIHWQAVKNLARQAPWRQCRCHSHPCRPVARPRFRCRSRGHPPRLGASTDLCHITLVAISPTAGRSRPLSFVSIILLARPFSCPLRLLSPID